MKKMFTKMMVVALAVVMLLGAFGAEAFADSVSMRGTEQIPVAAGEILHAKTNACKTVKGNTGSTVTFTVKTGKKESGGNKVTLTPAKGVVNRKNKFTGKTSTEKCYGLYIIYLTNEKTHKTTWTTMYNKKVTLTLSENTTYTIKVKPLNDSLFEQLGFCNFWYFKGWKTNATWSATKTKNVTFCK